MTPHFITPCYVRVETLKGRMFLAYKLIAVGYDVCPCVMMAETRSYELAAVFVFTIEQSAHIIEDRDFSENTIDCGTNTELFLALAGMRSDTDKGQWWWDEENDRPVKFQTLFTPQSLRVKCFRKATAQEIVEHFSGTTE